MDTMSGNCHFVRHTVNHHKVSSARYRTVSRECPEKQVPSKPNIDRRIQRSRTAIEDALLKLIREMGYNAITVEDICKEADVGRSTFYAHYTGKDDLKRQSIDKKFRRIGSDYADVTRPSGSSQSPFGFTLSFFAHAQERSDLYRALVAKGGIEVTLEMIRASLTRLAREDIAAQNKTLSQGDRELAAQFFVGAFIAVLRSWLDSGAKLSPEAVDAQFRRYLAGGLIPGLHQPAGKPE